MEGNKRQYEDAEGNVISRKKMKKLRRIMRRPEKPENFPERPMEKCLLCENPLVSFYLQYYSGFIQDFFKTPFKISNVLIKLIFGCIDTLIFSIYFFLLLNKEPFGKILIF